MTRKNISLVPAHYIRKQTTTNSERYITEELKLEEEKILGAEEKIAELEYSLFQELLQKIISQTQDIQYAATRIAVLDVLCSFASLSASGTKLEDMPTDAVIRAICEYRGMDAGDKTDRADASELWHVIRRAGRN